MVTGPAHPDRAARPPAEQWWVLNGADLMSALRRARDGEDPELLYLEYIANSDREDHGRDG